MTASLEFKAKNVDKAVEKASAELNMPKKDLKYKVLSYGSSGIFGLSSAKKAGSCIPFPKIPLISGTTYCSELLMPLPQMPKYRLSKIPSEYYLTLMAETRAF